MRPKAERNNPVESAASVSSEQSSRALEPTPHPGMSSPCDALLGSCPTCQMFKFFHASQKSRQPFPRDCDQKFLAQSCVPAIAPNEEFSEFRVAPDTPRHLAGISLLLANAQQGQGSPGPNPNCELGIDPDSNARVPGALHLATNDSARYSCSHRIRGRGPPKESGLTARSVHVCVPPCSHP